MLCWRILFMAPGWAMSSLTFRMSLSLNPFHLGVLLCRYGVRFIKQVIMLMLIQQTGGSKRRKFGARTHSDVCPRAGFDESSSGGLPSNNYRRRTGEVIGIAVQYAGGLLILASIFYLWWMKDAPGHMRVHTDSLRFVFSTLLQIVVIE
ncbi:uncharacterized protein LOC131248021 [Magnolia sinica]|uniref:uncharacterized protein LOC131248021 n=1 Tax=Magnolia sinica TaxID=86752 RepID=UPI0026591934|nr:uncharacterized protein LOC131248021 [Magnolia sinica]